MIRLRRLFTLIGILLSLSAGTSQAHTDAPGWDDGEEFLDLFDLATKCRKATKSQRALVDRGNKQAVRFFRQCVEFAGSEPWCRQIMRPNPESLPLFQCTYGPAQSHQLVNPDTSTWNYAFRAVRLVAALETEGIKPCLIYNWWRPEPYNRNVGGAPGRHPRGTSVDVRFCTQEDMELAFTKLCEWRANGQLRAIGYYGTTGLHLGVGDRVANTWGKACT